MSFQSEAGSKISFAHKTDPLENRNRKSMHGLLNFVFYNQEYSFGFSVSAIASISHKHENSELKPLLKYSLDASPVPEKWTVL